MIATVIGKKSFESKGKHYNVANITFDDEGVEGVEVATIFLPDGVSLAVGCQYRFEFNMRGRLVDVLDV